MEPFPQPPALPAETVAALITHVDECLAWLNEELRIAAEQGHHPSADQLRILTGYEFTARWLREAYTPEVFE